MSQKHKPKSKRSGSGGTGGAFDNPFDIEPTSVRPSRITPLRFVEITIFIVAVIIGINSLSNWSENRTESTTRPTVAAEPTEAPDYDGWLTIGRSAYDENDFSEAEAAFTNALEFDNERPDAYYWRGLARYQTGDYSKAIADFTRAIGFDYEPISYAYYFRGRSYQQQGSYSAAIENYTRSIELCSTANGNPNDCHLDWMRRGEVNLALNQFDQARSDLQKSLDIEASSEAASLMLDVYDDIARVRPDEVTPDLLLPYQVMTVQLNAGTLNIETIPPELLEVREPYQVTFEMIEQNSQLHLTFEANEGDTFAITAERVPRLTGPRPSDVNPVILIQNADGEALAYQGSGSDKIAQIDHFTAPESGTYTVIITAAQARTAGIIDVQVKRL